MAAVLPGAEAAEDPQIDGDPGEAAVLALKPTVDEMVKKAEEAGDQPKLLPPPQRKPKGGGPEEPVASLGVARYACPECSCLAECRKEPGAQRSTNIWWRNDFSF